MEEIKALKQTVSVYGELDNNVVEQPIDCDITLPDYCKDIQKILRCLCLPGVASVTASGSRLQAEGSVTVRILYVDEDEELGTYEQSLPFARYVELSEKSSVVFASCKIKTGYMNCRAVNKRRVDVHGAVSLCFCAGVKDDSTVVTGTDSGDIEKQTKALRLANSIADAGRYFGVTEVENLNDKPAVASLVHTTGYALVNEVKVIKDKALVKGDLLISIGYTSHESNRIEAYDVRMPLSQIVDAVGLDENEIIDTQLHVTQLNVIPKTDGAGEYKLLDISAKLMVEMHAYREEELEAVTDAYSTKCAVNLERKRVPVLNLTESIDESFVVRKNADISAGELTEVLDIWCDSVTSSYRKSETGIEIYGTANMSLIGASATDGYVFLEQSIDYTYKKELGIAGDVFCTPCIRAVGYKTSKNADDTVELSVEFMVKTTVFEKQSVELLNDITPSDDERAVSQNEGALIIYFAGKGENVWDIARRYNTTVKAVIAENELEAEILSDDKMLLIPR